MPSSHGDHSSDGGTVVLPQRNGGLVVWKLSDLPADAQGRVRQIKEGKGAAEADGFKSPALVVVVDRAEIEPREAEALSLMG